MAAKKLNLPKVKLQPKNFINTKKKYICTQCGGDAMVAWHNTSDEPKDYFGAILQAGERLCLACGKKRGVKFF